MPPDLTSHRLRARWVFPIDGSPIEDGVITIENGRIAQLNSGPDADATDLGDVAILPGLVNAHTHLEFSDLRYPLATREPFTAWIRTLLGERQRRGQSVEATIRFGIAESVAAGTTLIGEIATDDVFGTHVRCRTARVVVFRELLGISEDVIPERLETARHHLDQLSAEPHADVVGGLSPHAPYSLSEELFHEIIALAVATKAPVAMHLAETQDELELLERGTGPFVDMLKEFGVWRDLFWILGDSVWPYLEELSKAERALVIHGNYLTDDEMDFLARHPQMTVVYCPRTHHYFGHDEHPWRTLLERGAAVALGTDSRASNPDLSLWKEVVSLHETFEDVPADTLLELATIRGATALGLGDDTGTLTIGKSADLVVISFCDEANLKASSRPTDALMHPGNRVVRTMRGGCWVSASVR